MPTMSNLSGKQNFCHLLPALPSPEISPPPSPSSNRISSDGMTKCRIKRIITSYYIYYFYLPFISVTIVTIVNFTRVYSLSSSLKLKRDGDVMTLGVFSSLFTFTVLFLFLSFLTALFNPITSLASG